MYEYVEFFSLKNRLSGNMVRELARVANDVTRIEPPPTAAPPEAVKASGTSSSCLYHKGDLSRRHRIVLAVVYNSLLLRTLGASPSPSYPLQTPCSLTALAVLSPTHFSSWFFSPISPPLFVLYFTIVHIHFFSPPVWRLTF